MIPIKSGRIYSGCRHGVVACPKLAFGRVCCEYEIQMQISVALLLSLSAAGSTTSLVYDTVRATVAFTLLLFILKSNGEPDDWNSLSQTSKAERQRIWEGAIMMEQVK